MQKIENPFRSNVIDSLTHVGDQHVTDIHAAEAAALLDQSGSRWAMSPREAAPRPFS